MNNIRNSFFVTIDKEAQKKLALMLLYEIVLVFFLVYVLHPMYAMANESKQFQVNFSIKSFIFGLFFLACISLHWLKIRKSDNFSNIVLELIELVYFIPGIAVVFCYGAEFGLLLLMALFWIVLVFLNHLIPQFKSVKSIYSRLENTDEMLEICSAVVAILAIVFGIFLGSGLETLFLDDIYTVRLAYRERNVHWIIIALYTGLSLIIPVLVSETIEHKKYWITLLLVFGQIMLFTIACNKTFLYVVAISLFISLFKFKRNYLLELMVATFLLGCIMYRIFGIETVADALRREFVAPTSIANYYYKYFILLKNKYYYLTYTWPRITNLLHFQVNYKNPIGMTIGSYFFSDDLNMNNGLVGAGIAKFGLLSVIIMPFSYIIGFRIIDSLINKKFSEKKKLIIGFTLANEIINTPDFTAVFLKPSPIMLFLLFLFLYPSQDESLNNKEGINGTYAN